MSNATRYTAQGRRDAETRRAAKLAERDARHAAMPVEEFLAEWFELYAIRVDDECEAHARRYHADLIARFAA